MVKGVVTQKTTSSRLARFSVEKNIFSASSEIAMARRTSASFCGDQLLISTTSGFPGPPSALELAEPESTTTRLSAASASAIAAI